MKKSKQFGLLLVTAVWLALCAMAWFWPRTEVSYTERRKLAQFPTVLSPKFPTDFESASLDQFPFRDRFRQLKALTQYDLLRQSDNNGIYLAQGYAAKLEYPVNEASLQHASDLLQQVYDDYLTASEGRIFLSVVPDKGYYLAEAQGYPAMDYAYLLEKLQKDLPFAAYVDVTGALTAEDYYRTDTHWRQERLFGVARILCDAMGLTAPKPEDFTQNQAEQPFYGVYYGQAALPMKPDTIYTLENELLRDCTVSHLESGKADSIYDWAKLDSRDPYEVYLSGADPLQVIRNPQGDPNRKLLVFRDSFASSLLPLLIADYGEVTVVDLRYIPAQQLGNYVDFQGQDVLLLYSTLVLNSSFTMK